MTVEIVTQEVIQRKILLIRGKKVMLDRDLAALYEVPTHRLNERVKRNLKRFPEDFMFRLTNVEKEEVIANCDNLKTLKYTPISPNVFTEHGILMLSSILNSERAIEVNIQIMRIFVKMRELMVEHRDLREKIENMEKKYDYQFKVVFEAIKKLLDSPEKPKSTIGFHRKWEHSRL